MAGLLEVDKAQQRRDNRAKREEHTWVLRVVRCVFTQESVNEHRMSSQTSVEEASHLCPKESPKLHIA